MSTWNDYCEKTIAPTIGTVTSVWIDELNKAFGKSDKWAMIKNRTNTCPPEVNKEDMDFENLFFINYKFMYIPFKTRMWLYNNCGHYKDFVMSGSDEEWIPAFTEEMFEKKHKDAISVLKQYKKDSTRRKISDKARRVIFMVVATIIVIAVSMPSMIEASETTYKETMNETIHERNVERTQARLEADPTSVHVKMDELDISKFFDNDVSLFNTPTSFDKNVVEYISTLFYTDDIPTKEEFAESLRAEMEKRQTHYDGCKENGATDAAIAYAFDELFCGVTVHKFIESYHPERADEILSNLEYTEAE